MNVLLPSSSHSFSFLILINHWINWRTVRFLFFFFFIYLLDRCRDSYWARCIRSFLVYRRWTSIGQRHVKVFTFLSNRQAGTNLHTIYGFISHINWLLRHSLSSYAPRIQYHLLLAVLQKLMNIIASWARACLCQRICCIHVTALQ